MKTDKKAITGKPALISGYIDYHKGSVVSKEIVNRASGTVTIFAFDRGEGLSEHKAPFDALVQVIEGEALVTISGKLFNVKRGEMITMPANKPHSLKAIKKFKMILTMLR